jgi:LPS-assembly lipoprotein
MWLFDASGASASASRTTAVLGLAAQLLAGCGFHLAGSAPLPAALTRPYLTVQNPYSEFAREMKAVLQGAGAQLASGDSTASATIDVTRDQFDRRVLSVSARNTPTEYEVTYTVVFAVQQGDKEILAPQTITLSRQYSFDETALLAKDREENLLRADMARNLASMAMRRLGSLK